MKIQTVLLILYTTFLTDQGTLAAEFNIDISNLTINGRGAAVHYSTDEELKRFGITLENWDRFMKSSSSGLFEKYGAPKAVYYRNPTPDGDVFSQSLAEVNDGTFLDPAVTTITVLNSRVIKEDTVREVVATQDCINGHSESIKCSFGLKQIKTNTVGTSWSRNFGFAVGADVGFDIEIFKVSTKLSGDFHWGKTETLDKKIEIGTDMKVEATAGPRKTVRAFLTAERGTLTVAVDYVATIVGLAHLTYENYHSSAPIPMLLEFLSGKPDYSLQATQIIDITVFSNAKIEVKDLNPDS